MTCGNCGNDVWTCRNSDGVPVLTASPESDDPTLAKRFDTDENRDYGREFSTDIVEGMVAHEDNHHSHCELACGGII